MDGQRNKFNNELRTQYNTDRTRKAQEAILDGEGIYTGHLKAWMQVNSSRLPSSVVVFRDGVSEGEYQQVVNLEVDSLKQACSKVSQTKPIQFERETRSLTFILTAQGRIQS
jgi:eukaryotic translation initiation factor 2C